MIEKIKNWLDDKNSDYIAGVNLLYDLTLNVTQRESLSTHKSVEKLRRALSGLLEDQSRIRLGLAVEEKKENNALPKDNDPVIIEMEEDMKMLYKELAHYHTLLKEASTDEQRFKFAKLCVNTDAKQSMIYEQILYYKKFGKMPKRQDVDKKVRESVASLIVKKRSLLQLCRHYNKLIKENSIKLEAIRDIDEVREMNAKLDKWSHLLEEKEDELARIMNELSKRK